MMKFAITLTFAALSTAVFGATPQMQENVGLASSEVGGGVSDDEVQAFDVYDEITESIFESFRLYHPHECRDFFVRKNRSDGRTYVDRLRRCD
jgi:hypothetical protein